MAHGLQHAKETMQEELHAAKQEMRSSWAADLQQALLTLPLKGAARLPATSFLCKCPLTGLLLNQAKATLSVIICIGLTGLADVNCTYSCHVLGPQHSKLPGLLLAAQTAFRFLNALCGHALALDMPQVSKSRDRSSICKMWVACLGCGRCLYVDAQKLDSSPIHKRHCVVLHGLR